MTKIRKITPNRIRKISGGKDPTRLVEDFLIRRGFNPDDCLQQRTADIATWSVPVSEDEELEITLEGLTRTIDSTLYIGVNVCGVPLQDTQNFLSAALTVADTLIGAKLSVVNYDLVLSVTAYAENLSAERIDYFYELIFKQKASVYDAVLEEM